MSKLQALVKPLPNQQVLSSQIAPQTEDLQALQSDLLLVLGHGPQNLRTRI
jgi:hypothetical protein